MSEAVFYEESCEEVITAPGGGLASGQVEKAAGGRGGFVLGLKSVLSGELATLQTDGKIKVAASSAAWSKDDEIWWDASANVAVKKTNDMDGSADFRLGIAAAAKGSETYGYVLLNIPRPAFDPIVFEFDCEQGGSGDTNAHYLVPPEMNPNGLLILGVYGLISEVFGGSTQDQGIVTVKDTEVSPNTICTLTPTDTAGDILGDIVVGYSAPAASTGAPAKFVAAGKGITGTVTQQTTGTSKAGKMKVLVQAVPLV